MCRFAAYLGREGILLDELLSKPKNSLIKQSYKARQGTHGVNADGFGLAWYNFDVSGCPGIFKSIQPAWNDGNLVHLSQKIKSSCFMAHVRASTVGDVSQNNCHPFAFEEYAFVHNGTIKNFNQHKKNIINKIDEDLFLRIKGNTDSEFLFFLIMDFVSQNNDLETAVRKGIAWVVENQKPYGEFSRINIVITNGNELMATRFCNKIGASLSLMYSVSQNEKNEIDALTLSSEPLDDSGAAWNVLPENHYIFMNKNDMKMRIEPFVDVGL